MNGLSQTLILMIITCAVSIPAFNNRELQHKLLLYPPDIQRGQYYRFLTSGFVHADWQHLIFNMITLWSFGSYMERVLSITVGRFAFIFLYLSAIVVSDLPSYFKNRHNEYYASLGASGGVSAIMFGFVLFNPWVRFLFPPVPAIIYLVLYMIYSTYMSKKGNTGINHDAHIFGGLYGLLFTIIAYPTSFSLFLDQLMHPRWM